jgi:hypothetical protein
MLIWRIICPDLDPDVTWLLVTPVQDPRIVLGRLGFLLIFAGSRIVLQAVLWRLVLLGGRGGGLGSGVRGWRSPVVGRWLGDRLSFWGRSWLGVGGSWLTPFFALPSERIVHGLEGGGVAGRCRFRWRGCVVRRCRC